MKSWMLASLLALLVPLSQPCAAAESSGYRNIQDFGCPKADGTCFMTIDGPPVAGAPSCASNSVRWNAKNDVNGQNWLALVMMAKATGKKISLYIDSCYSEQPAYPTFGYGVIEG